MNNEQIELGGKLFSYIITYKPIRRFYFRFYQDIFYVNAPLQTKNHEVITLFKKNEHRLLRLTMRKSASTDLPVPLKLIGNSYEIIPSDTDYLESHKIYLHSLNQVDSVLRLTLPLLQAYIERRLPIYFDQMYPGHTPPEVHYKRAKGYYGRYQSKRHQITFNVNLVFLDEELIDYIIIHELAHIKHLNHQIEFYQFLGKILPNYRMLQKRLKKEGVNL